MNIHDMRLAWSFSQDLASHGVECIVELFVPKPPIDFVEETALLWSAVSGQTLSREWAQSAIEVVRQLFTLLDAEAHRVDSITGGRPC